MRYRYVDVMHVVITKNVEYGYQNRRRCRNIFLVVLLYRIYIYFE